LSGRLHHYQFAHDLLELRLTALCRALLCFPHGVVRCESAGLFVICEVLRRSCIVRSGPLIPLILGARN
jgi:hypothetical protein